VPLLSLLLLLLLSAYLALVVAALVGFGIIHPGNTTTRYRRCRHKRDSQQSTDYTYQLIPIPRHTAHSVYDCRQ